jgi:hypothetical protein
VSPVERLQHALHGWVAYGIMPFFAFAGGPLLETAKLAVLCSSALAGVLSLLTGRRLLRADEPGIARSDAENRVINRLLNEHRSQVTMQSTPKSRI